MASQPNFGLAGADSKSITYHKDILELPAGINLYQFIRMARTGVAEQTTAVSAWGIEPSGNFWPDSVSLSIQEESVQHEIFSGVVPTNTGDGSVKYDQSLVFRARATFTVSGKVANADTSWPDSFSSAIGAKDVGVRTFGTPSSTITTQGNLTEPRTEWHTFSYTKQWIIAGQSSGANILNLSGFTVSPDGLHVIGRTWDLSSSGFATESVTVENYPS
jgi:hypothetical protein